MEQAAGWLQPAAALVTGYPYLVLFVGLLLVGEVVLLPALFLASTGRLDWLWVILVAIVATVLSDLAWYLLGRWYPARMLDRLRERQPPDRVERLEVLFRRQGPRLLYLSKFVYGTRIVAQVLAGALNMRFGLYISVNLLGVVTVVLCLAGLSWAVVGSARQLEELLQHIELAFLLLLLAAASAYLTFGQWVRQRWFR
ncbi:MAG: DedA family protein [Pseudomonadota bacterium]|nr:MAG: DedA family protein [Pseudomonadota bacterium]